MASETLVEHDAASLLSGRGDGVVLDGNAVVLSPGSAWGEVASGEARAGPFDGACLSVACETPGDSTVEAFLQASLENGEKTAWLSLGVLGSPDDERRVPRSVRGPSSGPARVAVDTVEIRPLSLPSEPRGRALALRLVLTRASSGESPRVRGASAIAWTRGRREAGIEPGARPSWGKTLAVPERSQQVEDAEIAARICSPTSLAMVLSYLGKERKTAEVCREVLDREAGIYGNWALNVAYAARLGLEARIARFPSFAPLEHEIGEGRPVVISHRWSPGELEGAPIKSSDGHLIVVKGFTERGDLRVNDPAFDPRSGGKVDATYRRRDIERTWLERGDGIAYLVRLARGP